MTIAFLLGAVLNIQAAFLGWNALKTENYTVFFKSGYENQALESVNALEYYKPEVVELTGANIKHLPFVLEDLGSMSNGLANPVYHHIRLFTYPFSGQATSENWLSYVAKHELIHMHHFNNIGGVPKALSTVMGRIMMPNIFSPGWIYEGITVYGESSDRTYTGRLNDGYFDTYNRVRLSEENFPSLLSATYSPRTYPFGSGIYLYGGTFFAYLAETYGEDKFAEFFSRYGSSGSSYFSPIFPFLGIDRHARAVYGKSFPSLWKDWQQYLKQTEKPYLVSGDRQTYLGDYIDNMQVYNQDLYYARKFHRKTGSQTMFTFYEIVRLRDGEVTPVITTTSPITDFTIMDDKLWYGVDEIKSGYANTYNNSYGYQTSVRRKDLLTGEDRQIFQAEMRSFVVLDENTILYSQDRKDKFGSFLYEYNIALDESDMRYLTAHIIDRFKFYDDNLFVSARTDWENFSLYEFEPLRGQFMPLVFTPHVEQIVDIAGDKIFFTANYEDGHYLYYYDLEDNEVYRIDGEGFIRRASYDDRNDILYLAALNSGGYDVYQTELQSTIYEVPTDPFEAPMPNVLPTTVIEPGSYVDNLKTLLPGVRMPMLYAGTDETIVGMYLQGSDTIGHFEYGIPLLYHIENQNLYTDMFINSKLFSPVQTRLNFTNQEDDSELYFTVSSPLFRRLQPGVSHLSLALQTALFEDFDRLSYTPQIALGLRFPGLVNEFSFRIPLENRDYGSSINRMGAYLDFYSLAYLSKSHLKLSATGIYDVDNPSIVFPTIRGYDEELTAKKGAVVSADLSTRLLRIHKGLWNPNIFFEDLNANLFVTSAIPTEGSRQLAGGLELVLDGGLLFLSQSEWGMRVSYNREEELKTDLFFQIGMSW
jgi:hypothetical protein